MKVTELIAKQFREIHFGGNWTAACMKDKLAEVSWQQSIERVGEFHSIATLVFHMNYYVAAVTKVLQGGPLQAKDEFSFDHAPIESDEDWQNLLGKTWRDAEILADLIAKVPDEKLSDDFTDAKYGSYYRNLHGLIEHNHYHLGQIALLQKMTGETNPTS